MFPQLQLTEIALKCFNFLGFNFIPYFDPKPELQAASPILVNKTGEGDGVEYQLGCYHLRKEFFCELVNKAEYPIMFLKPDSSIKLKLKIL